MRVLWAIWPVPGISGARGSGRAAPEMVLGEAGPPALLVRLPQLAPLDISPRHLRGTACAHFSVLALRTP